MYSSLTIEQETQIQTLFSNICEILSITVPRDLFNDKGYNRIGYNRVGYNRIGYNSLSSLPVV